MIIDGESDILMPGPCPGLTTRGSGQSITGDTSPLFPPWCCMTAGRAGAAWSDATTDPATFITTKVGGRDMVFCILDYRCFLEEHKNNINWDFLVKTTQTLIGNVKCYKLDPH